MEKESLGSILPHIKQLFAKLRADLLRYECEIQLENDEIKETCSQKYDHAISVCEELDPLNDIKLGL